MKHFTNINPPGNRDDDANRIEAMASQAPYSVIPSMPAPDRTKRATQRTRTRQINQ